MAVHDLNLASGHADRIIMMKSGEIYAAGDPASVFTPENIEHVYGVETEVNHERAVYILPIRPIRG